MKFPSADPLSTWGDTAADCCAFIVQFGPKERCGDPCALRSSYCATHYRLTHIPRRSLAEAAQFRVIDTLAKLVGGRLRKGGGFPLPSEIEELERRALLAPLGIAPRARRPGQS